MMYDIRFDRRGGSTAVACCDEQFSMTRINIPKQKGLEVTALLIKKSTG